MDVSQLDFSDPDIWYRYCYEHPTYTWQVEFAKELERAIDDHVARRLPIGAGFALVASRQAGKNEIIARVENRILAKYSGVGGSIVKSAPTARPQLHISKRRLKEKFSENPLTRRLDEWEEGYICRCGKMELVLLSAEPSANRVGHTASTALFLDETQNIDKDIFSRDLRPMCASTASPVVAAGTVWDNETLLQQFIDRFTELQKKLGRRMVFMADWERVGAENSDYRKFVTDQIDILGEDHPIILTQYRLIPIAALGRYLQPVDLQRMRGPHPRQGWPQDGQVYVAGVDLCGSDETDPTAQIVDPASRPGRDSTVVTIAQLRYKISKYSLRKVPMLDVVDHLWLPGMHPLEATDIIYRFVFDHWKCLRCAIDANGVGDSTAAIIKARRPDQVDAVKSTYTKASEMGLALLGGIKTGRYRVYRDDSPESKEHWLQMELCKRETRPGGVIRYYAPTTQQLVDGVSTPIHDDFVKSAAYCYHAAAMHLQSGVDDKWLSGGQDSYYDWEQ